MKQQKFLFIIASILLFSISPLANNQQSKEPKTILDFARLLPEKYLYVSKEQFNEKVENGNIEFDIKNGYLRFQDSAEDDETITLFKKPDNTYIVGISITIQCEEIEPGTVTYCSTLYFLEYKQNKWMEVTNNILPVKYNEKCEYTLPKIGTTIIVQQYGERIYELVWKNGKFLLKK
jgi:hypothetical protein